MKRVVFAGRFDPVQEDHLEAARRSAAAAGLEEVLFLLLPDSPDQPCHAPFEDRYRMLELACKGQPGFSCGVRGQTGDELSENLCPEGVDEGTPPDRIRSMIADGYLYRIPTQWRSISSSSVSTGSARRACRVSRPAGWCSVGSGRTIASSSWRSIPIPG